MMAVGDGPIKNFPLRGIKDSPPYLHDGRLLTLDDTVEFFNLILGTQLTPQEKQDLVALALPRGGVPVAFEVAKALNAPLDIFPVRKLGIPGQKELAFGAIASG